MISLRRKFVASRVDGSRPLNISQLALVAVVALLAVTLAWAGDPWKDKTYQQWDAKDCQKIMSNSPWAQVVQVEATWKTHTGSYTQDLSRGPTDQSVGTNAMGGDQAVNRGPSSGGGNLQGEQPASMMSGGPTAQFLVRWASSDVERQAVVRNAILSGRMKEEDARKFLSAKSPEYQLLVVGPDMTPFASLDEKALLAAASLRPQKMKEGIGPTKVQAERDPNSKKVIAVLFVFPKQTSSGEPLVGPEEKKVDFVCKLGDTAVRASFDVKRMVAKEGQDL